MRQHSVGHVGVTFESMTKIREQLIREITNLQRQMENMRINDDTVNFSMLQTYKEMIHSRREMLAHLPREP